MTKPKFSITKEDLEMRELINETDKKILAIWAKDCAERVLPYFTEKFPEDKRPQVALDTLQEWIDTQKFSMQVIRKASLDAHKAAKDAGQGTPACSAAHACGQAVATAHVKTHAYGPAIYGQQAVFRASEPEKALEAAGQERDWQYNHLQELIKSK